MFKDVFILRKSAWHAKMMRYIWNLKVTDFSHMCPYWWLSVFNHIVFIPLFCLKESFRLLKVIFSILFGKIGKVYDKWREINKRRTEIRREVRRAKQLEKDQKKYQANLIKWEKEAAYYKANPEKLLEIKKGKNGDSIFEKIIRNIARFHYEEWQEIQIKFRTVEEQKEHEEWLKECAEEEEKRNLAIQKIKEKFLKFYNGEDKEHLLISDSWQDAWRKWETQKRQTDIEKEAARQRAAKERIVRIFKVVKPITTALAYIIGSFIAIFCLYWIYKGIILVINFITNVKHSSWLFFFTILKYVGISGICIIFILALFYLISTLRERRIYNKKDDDDDEEEFSRLDKILDVFCIISNFFGRFFKYIYKNSVYRLFKAVKNSIYFLIQMLKNNCPAIKWED